MKPFLYLDNWHTPQPKTRFDRMIAASGLPIERYRTNEGEFPNHSVFSGAYLSPSFDGAYDDIDWIHREHEVIEKLTEADVPMIGLCFGCQILASALVGRETVFKRVAHEGGRGEISLTQAGRADTLSMELPDKMDVFHWHGDEVIATHPDIIVLADGPGCSNHLWRWSRGPVWGVQPHPEMDDADLKAWLDLNRPRFENRGHDVDSYIAQTLDAKLARHMLSHFLDLVKMGQPVSA
jgi:GMP synthase (glutamine-hydrolysing)